MDTDKLYGSIYGSRVYHDVHAKFGRVDTDVERNYYESVCGGVFFFSETRVDSKPPLGKTLCPRGAQRRPSEG